MKKIEKIKELVKELNKHRDAYYNDSKPTISDPEYDRLFDKLQNLEEETGIIMSNSPTQTVGYEVKSKLEKVKHENPMLSLDKTKSVNELNKFVGDKDAIVMLKLDGLTVAVTYENGIMIKAETRGNGSEGELITANAKTFVNLPTTIPYKDKLVVFGEAIITYDDFKRINNKLSENEKYKNPRNLVSGSVRQLDNKICAERNVKFIAWRLVEGSDNNDFYQRLLELKNYGFDVVPTVFYNTYEIEQILEEAHQVASNDKIPIDGCVISYRDIKYMDSLGATSHHMRSQYAFKYTDEEVETTLLDIEWSMGKSGQLTPVAIFESVELDGTTVSRASIHNVSILTKLDLQVGDTITVYKSNQIIPQIRENLSANNREGSYIQIPSYCPVCEHQTEIIKDNDTEVLMCVNPSCKGKLLGRLSHFVSKKGMEIDGLSDETLKKFIELGWAKNISDIYNLPTHFNELSKMNGFGKKSVVKLQTSIEQSKTTDLQHFIAALSIPNIGTSQSKELCKTFKTWDDFSEAGFGNYDFSQLEGFGAVLNSNIHTWFDTMYKEDQIDQLARNITFTENENSISTEILKGKTFVITGSLEHYKNREELKSVIERNGGKVSGSISKNTFALINNNINSTSSKNKKANSLGVQIISEEDFIQLISK